MGGEIGAELWVISAPHLLVLVLHTPVPGRRHAAYYGKQGGVLQKSALNSPPLLAWVSRMPDMRPSRLTGSSGPPESKPTGFSAENFGFERTRFGWICLHATQTESWPFRA